MTADGTKEVPDGPWVDLWLSPARLSRYLTQANGDRPRALAIYEWNAQVGAALHRDLAHLEIALRNAYDAAAHAHWSGSGHWLLDDAAQVFAPVLRAKRTPRAKGGGKYQVDINRKPRELVARAIRDAGGQQASAGKVVAELNFGFWRYLSSSAHEKTLWVPVLHHAFPTSTSRADVDQRVGRLHALRNRVAHHEPLLHEDLPTRFTDLLTVAEQLHPHLAEHVRTSSPLPGLLRTRP